MNLLKIALITLLLLATNPANAAILDQWKVSDAVEECNGGPHGLWTNTLRLGDGICKNAYSFQAGGLFTTFDDGTATLVANAKNSAGYIASIDFLFSDLEDYATFSSHGTVKGDHLGDETTWDFYTMSEGTIMIDGETYSLWGDGVVGSYGFQLGVGANDKTGEFGASTWLELADSSGNRYSSWEINLDLTPVPEPAFIALFGIGLLGLGFISRVRSQST